jgi:hypothetical protein
VRCLAPSSLRVLVQKASTRPAFPCLCGPPRCAAHRLQEPPIAPLKPILWLGSDRASSPGWGMVCLLL